MRSLWAATPAVLMTALLLPHAASAADLIGSARSSEASFRPPAPSAAPPVALDPAPPASGRHPLELALEFARNRAQYVQDHVRDFTCLLVRRERIEGKLRNFEYIRTSVRMQQSQRGQITVPFSVYMQFLGPPELKGRKVLYVAGANTGKMIVRNGGRRFSYVTLRIAPDSDTALRESRYPITELSLETVARRMIEKAEDDVQYDPLARNTAVTFFQGAAVENRPCTRVRVVHPAADPNFSFHIAEVYVDDELHVPIRVEGYDWPRPGASEPRLLEEYTFTRLRLNVGLNDSDFSPQLLER